TGSQHKAKRRRAEQRADICCRHDVPLCFLKAWAAFDVVGLVVVGFAGLGLFGVSVVVQKTETGAARCRGTTPFSRWKVQNGRSRFVFGTALRAPAKIAPAFRSPGFPFCF